MNRGDELARAIGRRLIAAREATPGMTQERLAAKVGIHWTTLSKYEIGTTRNGRRTWAKIPAETLLAIERELGIESGGIIAGASEDERLVES